MTIDIFSVIPLLLISISGDQPLSSATGFLWNDRGQYYLVTNFHVLSGKHPMTGKIEDEKRRTPTKIRVFHNATNLGAWKPVDYDVVDGKGRKKWREHPKFGSKVDVVMLPIKLPASTTGYAINDQKFTDLQLRPAESVSIVGFPKGQTAGGLFGIWHTGHIASEPEVDFEGLPAMLVDSKAWPGNSGSPVIARRYGSWSKKDGSQSFGGGNGFATDFLGIYSGQLGAAEMKFVWKGSVIREILK